MKASTSLLPFKRSNKPQAKLGAVAEELEHAIPFSSIIFQSPAHESVEFYGREEIEVGKMLQSGRFFEWHKVERSPHQDGSERSLEGEESNHSRAIKKQNTLYSVKQLNAKNFTSSRKTLLHQAALRLVLEAKYLSHLNHPHILQAKGLPFGEDATVLEKGTSDCFFIVTSRVVETLESRLARWRQYQGDRKAEVESLDPRSPTLRKKLRFARELASALAYLHERNLVLLNLSPQTIGFLEDGTIQITDLSCCQEVEPEAVDSCSSSITEESEEEELERTAQAFTAKTRVSPSDVHANYVLQMAADGGVPRYVAPEAILHEQYTFKADVYSWSLILFELLTLAQPYIAFKTPHHLMRVCVEGQRPNLSLYKLPRDLKRLLCTSWSQTACRRPAMSKVVCAIPVPQREKVTVTSPQA